MLSFIPVNNFELSIETMESRVDVVHLVLKINNFNYFRFPYYASNIDSDLINDLKHIISGKEKKIDLNFNLNYNLISFEKDCLYISLLNSNNGLSQELRIYFENNSTVRNGLRTFISNYKPIDTEIKDIIENYVYHHGVYFKNTEELPSIEKITIEKFQELYGKKHETLNIFTYNWELFEDMPPLVSDDEIQNNDNTILNSVSSSDSEDWEEELRVRAILHEKKLLPPNDNTCELEYSSDSDWEEENKKLPSLVDYSSDSDSACSEVIIDFDKISFKESNKNDELMRLLINCLDNVNDIDLYTIARDFTYKLFENGDYVNFNNLKDIFKRDYELLCDIVEGESTNNDKYKELYNLLNEQRFNTNKMYQMISLLTEINSFDNNKQNEALLENIKIMKYTDFDTVYQKFEYPIDNVIEVFEKYNDKIDVLFYLKVNDIYCDLISQRTEARKNYKNKLLKVLNRVYNGLNLYEHIDYKLNDKRLLNDIITEIEKDDEFDYKQLYKKGYYNMMLKIIDYYLLNNYDSDAIYIYNDITDRNIELKSEPDSDDYIEVKNPLFKIEFDGLYKNNMIDVLDQIILTKQKDRVLIENFIQYIEEVDSEQISSFHGFNDVIDLLFDKMSDSDHIYLLYKHLIKLSRDKNQNDLEEEKYLREIIYAVNEYLKDYYESDIDNIEDSLEKDVINDLLSNLSENSIKFYFLESLMKKYEKNGYTVLQKIFRPYIPETGSMNNFYDKLFNLYLRTFTKCRKNFTNFERLSILQYILNDIYNNSESYFLSEKHTSELYYTMRNVSKISKHLNETNFTDFISNCELNYIKLYLDNYENKNLDIQHIDKFYRDTISAIEKNMFNNFIKKQTENNYENYFYNTELKNTISNYEDDQPVTYYDELTKRFRTGHIYKFADYFHYYIKDSETDKLIKIHEMHIQT